MTGLREAILAMAMAMVGTALEESQVHGVVRGEGRPLAGARLYPDRSVRVNPSSPVPWTLTRSDGGFDLELGPGDGALVVEKDGWQRDFIPRSEWECPIRLHRAPGFRREAVAVIRLEPEGLPQRLDDAALRRFLFSREPGVASAANYLYEISKGSLLLEEGLLFHSPIPALAADLGDSERERLARLGLEALRGRKLGSLDRVDNRDGSLHPDGKADHVWVFLPGLPGSVTADPRHLRPACLMLKPGWSRGGAWPVVVLTEEAPLGNLVHEALHAMGEHRVDDLYRDCDDPRTAGVWDLMDAGQYRGWDGYHPAAGPWREDTGYSPSHPGPWVRSELWYRGRFAATVRTQRVACRSWSGWLDPIVRAPSANPQRLVVPDPAGGGRFWEFWVARPLGFEAGLVGGRTGPGRQGLVVARVDPPAEHRRPPGAPVRVVDAHPDSPEPPQPRLPCGRWQLDDAAFGLGPGETARGADGALAWEVQDQDGAGRLQVRVTLRSRGKRP